MVSDLFLWSCGSVALSNGWRTSQRHRLIDIRRSSGHCATPRIHAAFSGKGVFWNWAIQWLQVLHQIVTVLCLTHIPRAVLGKEGFLWNQPLWPRIYSPNHPLSHNNTLSTTKFFLWFLNKLHFLLQPPCIHNLRFSSVALSKGAQFISKKEMLWFSSLF